jgi:PAT family beta-lactamase induction signal transducer AmpG
VYKRQALILAEHLSWNAVYALLAIGLVVGIAATLLVREPDAPARPTTLDAAVVAPFRDWFTRQPLRLAVVTLLFAMIYKLDDALAGNLLTTFILQHGYTKAELGAIQGFIGLVAGIAGALVGGVVISRIGVHRALWVLGVAQVSGVFAFAWLARQPLVVAGADHAQRLAELTAAVCIENGTAGLGTAALVAFLTSRCNPAFSATQFALLTSLMAGGRTWLAAPAGSLKEALAIDWPTFFLCSAAAGIPGLLLLPFVAPWRSPAQPLNASPDPAVGGR